MCVRCKNYNFALYELKQINDMPLHEIVDALGQMMKRAF